MLFDRNSNSKLGELLRPAADLALGRLLPPPPLPFRLTIIANADPGTAEMVERIAEPGEAQSIQIPLNQTYPRNVFSLSHVALPFPTDGTVCMALIPIPPRISALTWAHWQRAVRSACCLSAQLR